jgi:hypothetical protein
MGNTPPVRQLTCLFSRTRLWGCLRTHTTHRKSAKTKYNGKSRKKQDLFRRRRLLRRPALDRCDGR